MAQTPEGKRKAKISRFLKKMKQHGVWYCMPQGTGYGKGGVPDYVVCINGTFFGIEAKADKKDGGKPPTPLQLRTHEKIREAGGEVMVVGSDEDQARMEELVTKTALLTGFARRNGL